MSQHQEKTLRREVRSYIEAMESLEKINIPHRGFQKTVDRLAEDIFDHIMSEVIYGKDIFDAAHEKEDLVAFITEWAKQEDDK